MSLGSASLEIQVRTEDVRRAQQDLRRLADTGGNVDRAVKVVENRMSLLERAAASASRELRTYRDIQRASGGQQFEAEVLKSVRTLRSAEGALNAAGRAVQKLRQDQNGATASTERMNASVQKLHGVLGSIRGLMATFGAGVLARGIIETGNAFQGVRQKLLAVFGTAQKASAEFAYISGVAYKLGISVLGLSDSYAQLASAAQGTSVTGDKLKLVFESLAETSAIMRFDVENTRGVIKAFEQMLSKGTVQAEELRNQLGDRLPGAFNIFVRAFFGVTEATQAQRAEFNKLMKDGKVMAADILPKVAVELRRTFGMGLAAAIGSAQAAIGRMQQAWQNLVLRMWDGGLEGAVKNVAAAIESLLSNEGTVKMMLALASAIQTLSQILYDFRQILLPASLALATFVGIFTAGKVVTALGLFAGSAKSTLGIVSLLTAGVVGLATAMAGLSGSSKPAQGSSAALSRTSDTLATLSAAMAPDRSGGQGAPLAINFAESSNFSPKAALMEMARAAIEYIRVQAELKKQQDATNASIKEQGQDLKAINWGGMISAGLTAASVVAMLRPKIGPRIANARSRFSEARGEGGSLSSIGAFAGAMLPESVQKFGAAAGSTFSSNMAKSMISVEKFSEKVFEAEGKLRSFAAANAMSAPLLARSALGMAGMAGSASKLAPALVGVAGAMAGLRTVGQGLFALLGGFPGLIIGGIAALGFALYELGRRTKEQLTVSPENEDYMKFLESIGKTPIAPGVKVDAVVESNQKYLETLKARSEAEKGYTEMRKDFVSQQEALTRQLANSWQVSASGMPNSSLEAATMFKFKAGRDGATAQQMNGISDAIKSEDILKLRAIAAEMERMGNSNPNLAQTAEEFRRNSQASGDLAERINTLKTRLKDAAAAWGILGASARQAAADAKQAAADVAAGVSLPPDVAAFVADAEKDARIQLRYGRLTSGQRRVKELQDAALGINPKDPKVEGAVPLKPGPALDSINSAIDLARQAENVTKPSRSSGRGAESRANAKQEAYARAQQTIYGLLDPVKAERIALDEEIRELNRSLTRGGMGAAEATALLAQYRQLREEETAAAARAGKRAVDAEYFSTMGGNGRKIGLDKIETELDSFRIAALRAGKPIEEINTMIDAMRPQKVREMELAFEDMRDTVSGALNELNSLQRELAGLQGQGDLPALAAIQELDDRLQKIAKDRIDAEKKFRSVLAQGDDPVQAMLDYGNVLSALDDQERVSLAIKKEKIAALEREGKTMAGLARLTNDYIQNGALAQQDRAQLAALGPGRDVEGAVAAMRRSGQLLKEMFPDGDPEIIGKLPELLDAYGRVANDTITPWYRKIQAIYEEIQKAKAAAQNDFSLGLRSSPNLTSDEMGAAAQRGAEKGRVDVVVEKAKEQAAAVDQAWKTAGDRITDTVASIFNFDSEIKSLQDFARSVIQTLQQMVVEFIKVQVIKPWIDKILGWIRGIGSTAAASMGSHSSSGNTLLNIASKVVGFFAGGSAKGNIFDQTGIRAFSHGGVTHMASAANDNAIRAFAHGVVKSPTYFPMANGQTGLMGEAGPEGVLPLTRTRNGNLGVHAIGGGGKAGGNVYNINITVQGDGHSTPEDMVTGAKKARETIKGIAAETYMEMQGHESQRQVAV